jgi:dsDNA-specific endonuclease/ATPase MutS2
MDPEKLDRRMQERLLRQRRLTPEVLEKARGGLPDLAGEVEERSEEELEALRSELESERVLRAERIERAKERAASPAPPRRLGPLVPLDESEL